MILEGTQPTLTQVPPSVPRSIRVTCAPSSAARIAAAKAAEPAPRMATCSPRSAARCCSASTPWICSTFMATPAGIDAVTGSAASEPAGRRRADRRDGLGLGFLQLGLVAELLDRRDD